MAGARTITPGQVPKGPSGTRVWVTYSHKHLGALSVITAQLHSGPEKPLAELSALKVVRGASW